MFSNTGKWMSQGTFSCQFAKIVGKNMHENNIFRNTKTKWVELRNFFAFQQLLVTSYQLQVTEMPQPFILLLAGLVKLGVRKEIGDMAKIPCEPITRMQDIP